MSISPELEDKINSLSKKLRKERKITKMYRDEKEIYRIKYNQLRTRIAAECKRKFVNKIQFDFGNFDNII